MSEQSKGHIENPNLTSHSLEKNNSHHIEAFSDQDSEGRINGDPILPGEKPFAEDIKRVSDHIIVYRLADKRQVFRHFVHRNVDSDSRITHTTSVRRIAETISSALGLNIDLSSAIALCHDVAHCPYGHLGETVLNEHLTQIGQPEYDHVNAAPYVLYEVCGLNLTKEVLEGVKWHSLSSGVLDADVPNEYKIAAIADKVAYVFGDAWDSIRLIRDGQYSKYTSIEDEKSKDLGVEIAGRFNSFGENFVKRYETVAKAIVSESTNAGRIQFSDSPVASAFQELKDLLSKEIYTQTDSPEDISRLNRVLNMLVQSDLSVNPYLLFSLLTDLDLETLDSRDSIDPDMLNKLPFSIFNLPQRDDYSFLDPNYVV